MVTFVEVSGVFCRDNKLPTEAYPVNRISTPTIMAFSFLLVFNSSENRANIAAASPRTLKIRVAIPCSIACP
jgi:hypothetical protein